MKRLACGVVASASLIFSCAESGQTGSADCAPVPLSCECESLAGKSLVQATVLAVDIDAVSVSLEIEQVLNPSPLLDESEVHSEVVGRIATGYGCAQSELVAPRVGDTVFATFFAYTAREPNTPRDVGGVVVVPWSDPVDVGNGRPLAVSEAVTLVDPATCEAQHPRPPTPPCNDTSHGCSVSAPPSRHSSPWLWSAFALLGLLVLSRSRAHRSEVRNRSSGGRP